MSKFISKESPLISELVRTRKSAFWGHSLIIGKDGSGKTTTAKAEIAEILASTNDVVAVIDTTGDYIRFAEANNGQVIRLAPGSTDHINPFDVSTIGEDDNNLGWLIEEYIEAILQSIFSDRYGFSPLLKTCLSWCIKKIYAPFLASQNKETKEYDRALLPTLSDLVCALHECSQNDWNACSFSKDEKTEACEKLIAHLKPFINGDVDLFIHPSNIKYSSRLIIYDVSGCDAAYKGAVALFAIENIWGILAPKNCRENNKKTWIFIDDSHWIIDDRFISDCFRPIYKTARYRKCKITIISSSVTALLLAEGHNLYWDSAKYVHVLGLTQQNHDMFAKHYALSPALMEHIKNAPAGQGMVCTRDVMEPEVILHSSDFVEVARYSDSNLPDEENSNLHAEPLDDLSWVVPAINKSGITTTPRAVKRIRVWAMCCAVILVSVFALACGLHGYTPVDPQEVRRVCDGISLVCAALSFACWVCRGAVARVRKLAKEKEHQDSATRAMKIIKTQSLLLVMYAAILFVMSRVLA